MNKLLNTNLGFERIITYTSRSPRPDELEGRDYHFVSRGEFEKMIARGEFLEYVDYAEDYKGTHKTAVLPVLEGKKLIWRIDMSRAAAIQDTFRKVFDGVTAEALIAITKVVLLSVSDLGVLKKRMMKRDQEKFDESNFVKRMDKDLAVFKKYPFQYLLNNEENKLDEAFSELLKIVSE